MKKWTLLIGALVALTLTSCTADANFRAYVIAHRLSYDARSDTYLQLVDESTKIVPEDKVIIHRKEAEEGKLISEAEKLLGITK